MVRDPTRPCPSDCPYQSFATHRVSPKTSLHPRSVPSQPRRARATTAPRHLRRPAHAPRRGAREGFTDTCALDGLTTAGSSRSHWTVQRWLPPTLNVTRARRLLPSQSEQPRPAPPSQRLGRFVVLDSEATSQDALPTPSSLPTPSFPAAPPAGAPFPPSHPAPPTPAGAPQQARAAHSQCATAAQLLSH